MEADREPLNEYSIASEISTRAEPSTVNPISKNCEYVPREPRPTIPSTANMIIPIDSRARK
jgi:hypothetical protein